MKHASKGTPVMKRRLNAAACLLAAALFADTAHAVMEVMRETAAHTGSLLDESAYSGSSLANLLSPSPENGYRFQANSETDEPYVWTAPTTNLLGAAWFYHGFDEQLPPPRDIDVTVDATGCLFAQRSEHEGQVLNSSGRDAFRMLAWGYGAVPLSLGGLTPVEESFALSNTVMRTRLAANTWDFRATFTGGFFSLAGRDGAGTSGRVSLSQQVKDGDSDFSFVETVACFPDTAIRGAHRNGRFLVTNAVFRSTGAMDVGTGSNSTSPYRGTNVIEVVGASTFSIASGLTLGNTHSPELEARDRANRRYFLTVRGSAAKAEVGGSIRLFGVGETALSDGATFRGVTSSGTMLVGRDSADAKADLTVTGAGTTLDLANVSSLQLAGVGTFAVSDGASAKLPKSVMIGTGANARTRMVVSGDSTRVVCDAAEETGFYVGLNSGSAATVDMNGGFLGRGASGADAADFRLRLGHERGASGVLNMTGGKIGIPSGGLDVGLTGSGTLNMSGGEIEIGNGALNLGLLSCPQPATSTLVQTGGRILAGGGVNCCASQSDANRACIVRLDGGTLAADFIGRPSVASSLDFSADGGTLQPCQSRTDPAEPFLCGPLAVACGGQKGLTIDTAGLNVVGLCRFGNKSGETGILKKAGRGQYEHRGADGFDVSRTVVAEGTFLVGGETAHLDTVVVLEGGTFSLKGPAQSLTIRGLRAGAGTLLVDPSDHIVVTGPEVDLAGLRIALAETPTPGATLNLFTFEEPLSEANQTALESVYVMCDVPDGRHGRLAYAADSGALTYAVVDDADPLGAADTVTWTGRGDWATAANWSGGQKPSATQKASFVANAADRAVSVSGVEPVGAIAFGATGFALGGTDGATVCLAAEQGAAEVTVAEGAEATVDVPLSASMRTSVNLKTAEGAALTLLKPMTAGAFAKSGTGRLELAAANSFVQRVKTSGGVTRVAHARALDGAADVQVVGDTLALDAEGLDLPRLSIAAPREYVPVVLDVRQDATVRRMDVTGGFEKRGAGTLTVDVRGAEGQMCLTTGGGKGENRCPASYADTGFAPDGTPLGEDFATGLLVTEGELVLKGDGTSASTVQAKGQFTVGMNVTNMNVAAQPKLTLDGVWLDGTGGNGASSHSAVGWGLGRSQASGQRTPSFELRNGARYRCNTLRLGLGTSNRRMGDHSRLTMTGSALIAGAVYFESEIAQNPSVVRCTNALVATLSYPIYTAGAVDLVFSNSRVGAGAGSLQSPSLVNEINPDPDAWDAGKYNFGPLGWNTHLPTGRVEFADGSLLRARLRNYNLLQKPFEIVWDDSEWDYGKEADYAFDETVANDLFTMTVRGKGLKLRPSAGTTFTVVHPIVGDGGVCNVGAGAVKFAADALAFSGTCRAAPGAMIDLSEAGPLSGVKFGGAGTVSGGTFRGRVSVMSEMAEDGHVTDAPTFTGCDFTGATLLVDCGRTAESPLADPLPTNVRVARLVNCTGVPALKLKSRSTGRTFVSGAFAVDPATGDVYLDVVSAGLMLIVR